MLLGRYVHMLTVLNSAIAHVKKKLKLMHTICEKLLINFKFSHQSKTHKKTYYPENILFTENYS